MINNDLPAYLQKKKSPLGAYQQVGTFEIIITYFIKKKVK
jgi:hypothetical protein